MVTREIHRQTMEEKNQRSKIGYNLLDKSKQIGYTLRNGTIELPDSDAWGCSNKEENGFSCALPIFSVIFLHSYIGYSSSHLRLSRHNEPDGSYARGASDVFK